MTTPGFRLRDLPALEHFARQVRDHLRAVGTFFDFGTAAQPTYQRGLNQLVFSVNRQNYFSLVGSLETDHVIPAGQLSRALLEESIRWEWMTDAPDTRMGALVGELRRNLGNIEEEGLELGTNCQAFLNPSPFWNTEGLRPFRSTMLRFPSIDVMLRDIQTAGDAALAEHGVEFRFKVRRGPLRPIPSAVATDPYERSRHDGCDAT